MDIKRIDFENSVWHALSVQDILAKIKTDFAVGLSSSIVEDRRLEFGLNSLTPKKNTPIWLMFLLQFHQPLIYILLAATAVTFLLKEWVDAFVIFGVVIVNAVIGFIQEAKALKALDVLSRSMASYTTVIRNGKEEKVSSVYLVPGDIVMVSSGDKVPADIKLFQSRDLSVNESALTGESVPVKKRLEELDGKTALADRTNMIYASTFVTYGQARGIVVATGDMTEVGRISELISSAEDLKTPLTIKIAHLSHKLLYAILALSAITFVIGVLRGNSFVDMFMAVVALAVGAIPEGLPAAVTITLAIGVSRMAKRNVIIRKLPAVETLGSTAVICSDKTGTLTENQMTVQQVLSGERVYELSGIGYSSEGEISLKEGDSKSGHKALRECLTAGYLCNDSRVVEKEGRLVVEGDPTEGALIVSANKSRSIIDGDIEKFRRIDSIPFESEYQYMATLHEGHDGKRFVYIKGSMESILSRCVNQLEDDGSVQTIDLIAIEEFAKGMALQGLRVLAFARMDSVAGKESIDHNDIEESLTFLGLQGMIDPARKEAIDAVKNCYQAGIQVKMITGDHLITAKAIAEKLGFKNRPADAGEKQEINALSGKELEKMNNDELITAVDKISVFARVTPEQKLRLVRALQARGYVTAMTGDGVNDAPALKQANIGVAMGLSGTEVAKEAADMVLLDDNFASIEAAVEEGRCVFDNLRKFIVWTLPTNVGEGFVILVAVFAGTMLPIVPVQILWINMTTAICLGLMLAFEPKELDIMSRPPVDPKTPIMTRNLVLRILYVGTLLVAGVFSFFMYERNNGATLEQARTVAVNVLVFGELFYLFNCRSLTRSIFSLGIFFNKWILFGVSIMIILQVLFTYLPVMNLFFHSAPIDIYSWMRILLVAFLLYISVGIEKKVYSSRNK
ncbi:MAG: cation-transporting P-type ATPase [Candidatus Omnitrophica bacterium]|nr:cation-transporting P-type ATPase [Candidatus Omnitrophota bacterium]